MNKYTDLLLAVLLSSLIGLERGWQNRTDDDGKRIAGLRTFTIIGIFAALSSFISMNINQYFIFVSFIGFSFFIISVYRNFDNRDIGITTEITMFAVFTISVLASYGYRYVASASAVIIMGVLSLKIQIHEFIKKISIEEIIAMLKFLILVAVIYPLLPDTPIGSWTTITYSEIFKIVIVIASISFLGYISIKILGSEKGILTSSILGGLVSSTAVTISLSKYYNENDKLPDFYIFGILLSWLVMFFRILIIAIIFNPDLALSLGLSILSACLYIIIQLFIIRNKLKNHSENIPIKIQNPIDIVSSIKFALILSIIVFFAEKGKMLLGKSGVIAAAFFSGLADVDAITIYLSKLSMEENFYYISVYGILIASAVNTLVKGIIANFIGGKSIGLPLLKYMVISICIVAAVNIINILLVGWNY
ncbi:MAG: MgtC/SapB family protein [Calditerrivibrio sp.]|nr:MgtC/SapB family protein [Calditerrivibrio sp.]MCA1931960.1 MgtC/SapB family protein [Calditerrivibrio sp.]MCA1981087.1 MgtC/SapB family protein [Calditerrivibrio sp.]